MQLESGADRAAELAEQDSQAPAGRVLRYVIVGAGAGIASTHIQALQQLPGVQIAALSDIDAQRAAPRAELLGCPLFNDHATMLAEVQPDVAVICTPHPVHAALALDCFAAGAHVLVEKPMAVHVAEADQMIAAAERAERLLGVSFQQRFRPAVEYARRLIAAGELGPIVRTLCIEPWFRTAAYYAAATWRGTWQGEGGAVLLNQGPHPLDLFCHLAGMPSKVWGWTRTLYHAIQGEDTAQAMLEYPNGAPGYLVLNTTEVGVQRRMQLVGERAALELVDEQLTIFRMHPSTSEYMATSAEHYRGPDVSVETPALPAGSADHVAVHRDFFAAVTEGRQPRANGVEARMSLELANAITLSSYQGGAVDLPLDRAAYAALLEDLRAGRRAAR